METWTVWWEEKWLASLIHPSPLLDHGLGLFSVSPPQICSDFQTIGMAHVFFPKYTSQIWVDEIKKNMLPYRSFWIKQTGLSNLHMEWETPHLREGLSRLCNFSSHIEQNSFQTKKIASFSLLWFLRYQRTKIGTIFWQLCEHKLNTSILKLVLFLNLWKDMIWKLLDDNSKGFCTSILSQFKTLKRH